MILLELFFTFFKIGLFTFGGGYAMLPLIQSEAVSHGWIDRTELINFIAVSESTPGPFAVNVSTYIGTRMAGIPGGICATLGVVLPSFIIILIVAKCFEAFKNNKIVKGCMSGLKPAVVGLIASAVVSVGLTTFFPGASSVFTIGTEVFLSSSLYLSLAIFGVMLFCSLKKMHPILIICVSAAAGIGLGYAFGLPI